jgi:t-SNARE complex subunit (syntaxin)
MGRPKSTYNEDYLINITRRVQMAGDLAWHTREDVEAEKWIIEDDDGRLVATVETLADLILFANSRGDLSALITEVLQWRNLIINIRRVINEMGIRVDWLKTL